MPHNVNTWHAIFEPKSKLCCRLTQRNKFALNPHSFVITKSFWEIMANLDSNEEQPFKFELKQHYFRVAYISSLFLLLVHSISSHPNVFSNWWKWNDEKKTQLFCVNIALKCRLNSHIFFLRKQNFFFHCHQTFFFGCVTFALIRDK